MEPDDNLQPLYFGRFTSSNYRRQQTAWNLSYGGGVTIDMPLRQFTNVAGGHAIGRLFGLLLFILIGASLLGPVANATTGITVAHTGFTPSANITGTPGFVPLIQVLPLVFIGVVLGFGIDELASVL